VYKNKTQFDDYHVHVANTIKYESLTQTEKMSVASLTCNQKQ